MSSIKHWMASQYHLFSLRRVLSSEKITHYRILGIKRSGNHAIISWIQSGLEGLSSFCNDLRPEDPPQKALIKKTISGPRKNTHLLCSYEDYLFEEIFLQGSSPGSIPNSQIIDILVLRDPFNLFASWIAWQSGWGKNFREEKPYRENLQAMWKNHAGHFLNTTEKSPNKLECISYNAWISDKGYRENLAKRLGLGKAPKSLPKVSKFGHGSSFDGLAHFHQPGEMAVLERWKQVKDHPIFKEIRSDAEIQALNKQIFGWNLP